ncbi:TPA: type IV pilin protein [Vibrio vulnificus]|uniref:type IV pilin protein n=1 Tax=Vibrio vulnificus TaxID=672 RepID=UPI0015944D64|nr:type IV pilin protein [Vibrio vulnificus]EJE8559008.1 type IV pilin protein [Vibrio vulnificus]NVD19314.1 type IV pilin protein [Vibrio vulnificus]HAS8176364.1 type IV pilin protein [Vibrio vulnificus]
MEMIRKILCKKRVIRHKGMTLIELMIAVAIIGILTAISYPAYTSYVIKTHRHQVMADLTKVQLHLEDKRTTSGSYDFTIISGGTCSFCDNDTERYVLSIDSSGTGMDNYVLKAVPQTTRGQNDDACGTLSLNAAGVGKATKSGNSVSGCW